MIEHCTSTFNKFAAWQSRTKLVVYLLLIIQHANTYANLLVWWKTRVCGYAGTQICGYAGMRVCGYADMRVCGYAGMRICGYADMRVRRTGLTNRFQKLINNSKKNHSCEGVFICGKTHVDFHKTLTSIFSAYTTSIC